MAGTNRQVVGFRSLGAGGACAGRRWAGRVLVAACFVSFAGAGISCEKLATEPKPPPPPRYETLPPKVLPDYLKGTVLERMDHLNPDPIQVSNFGLVVNLPGTGDSTAPSAVREYIIKQMVTRGFGNLAQTGYNKITPEQVLDDPAKRTAIVRVDGFMTPGVRKGQTFDVVVTALGESGVTSLAGGMLYRTDLKFGGADARNPAGVIDVQGKAEGSIFINPSLTLNPQESSNDKNASRLSRRQGLILDGGIADKDQPLVLRMRAPQRSVMRQIERRIQQRFEDPLAASAKDEATMWLFVPPSFHGDWERFVGVSMNLYLDSTPEILLVRAKTLAAEALKKDAALQNISFAWEGMGPVALQVVLPLMDSKYPEDVQFAAARAAAFIGDPGARDALTRMATTSTHRFQLDAVRALGAMRQTPSVTATLRKLLESPAAQVRIEAYKVLAANKGNGVISLVFPKPGVDERFVLDIVQSSQPTVIYASRSGIPRIAIIGQPARLLTPITFAALDNRLTISSQEGQAGVTIFFRQTGGVGGQKPIKVQARPDLAELIGWLGGAAKQPDEVINLSYGEVVAIVQALTDQRRLVTADSYARGNAVLASFVLQDLQAVQDQIDSAPPIITRGEVRPQNGTVPGLPTTRFVGPELDKNGDPIKTEPPK